MRPAPQISPPYPFHGAMARPVRPDHNAGEVTMRIFGRTEPADAPPAPSAQAGRKGAGTPLPGPIVRTETKTYKPPYINERKKYELIIAASGQVVYDYDLPSGDIVWSGHVEQILGYEPQEMGGFAEWSEWIHPEDRDEAWRLLDIAEKDR